MTKTAKPLAGKKLDAVIEQAFYRNCSGVQINILEIPKIYKVARAAYAANLTVMAPAESEAAMVATMVSYVNAIKVPERQATIGEFMGLAPYPERNEADTISGVMDEEVKIDQGYKDDSAAAWAGFDKICGH